MKAKKEIYTNGSLQSDCDKPRDTIKVKEDMTVMKQIDTAENCISEQYAWQKKHYVLRQPIPCLNRNNKKSQSSINREYQEEIMAIIRRSSRLCLHPSVYATMHCILLNA